jgi:uncharacterized damage-inducible protein DinB
MQLNQACCHILAQLEDLLEQITDEDFKKPISSLNNSTLGQHLRHALEFFICLQKGVESGTVSYDKRAHDQQMEIDRDNARTAVTKIRDFINRQTENKKMILEVSYDPNEDISLSLETTYFRELAYNIEHAVHHLAIMKIGLREAAPDVKLPVDFGVAVSTIRHHRKNAALSAHLGG